MTLIAFAILGLLQLPLFLPLLKEETLATYVEGDLPLLSIFLTLGILVLCLRRAPRREHAFWTLLIAGHTAFLCGSAIYYLPISHSVGIDLSSDCFYLLYYAALLIALSISHGRDTHDAELQYRLRRSGGVILIFAAVAYFLLVPLYWNPAAYYTLIPSFYLYAICDLIVSFLYLRRASGSTNRRRRALYGWIGISNGIWCVAELLSCLIFAEVITWNWSGAINLFWSLPFIPLLFLLELPQDVESKESVEISRGRGTTRFSPLLLCAFIVPTVHLSVEIFGIFGPATNLPRDIVALSALFCLGTLALLENILLSRRQARLEEVERQLHQAQKMDAVGQLASGLVHDLRNFMIVIDWHAGMLRSKLPAEEPATEDLAQIEKAVEMTNEMLSKLRNVSRRTLTDIALIDVNLVLADEVEMLQGVLGQRVSLDLDPAENLASIRADPVQFRQVILNLCLNARDALSEEGGTIRLSTRAAEIDKALSTRHPWAESGSYVEIEVRDNGCGMDPETLERVFEPFFTTKGKRGSGLGLATVYGILRSHDGLIDVESRLGEGTSFRLFWPTA